MAVAVGYLDQLWADEHYQTLEPAATLLWDFGVETWEWHEGVRSWTVPALYVPVLALAKALGADGGAAAIIACRLFTALSCGFFLLRFCDALAPSLRTIWARALALGAVGFVPAMVAFGAATLSDTWALIAVWAATAAAQDALAPNGVRGRGAALRAGLWLGLAFVFRIQTAVFSVGLLAVLLLGGRASRSRLPTVLAGLCLVVVAGGLLDWATLGAPFHSTVAYARVHLAEDTATLQGAMPWHGYATLLYEQLGPVATLTPIVAALAAVLSRVARIDANRALLVLPSALFALAHCFIAHKELRFILPALPALFVLGACAAEDLAARVRDQARAPEDDGTRRLAMPAKHQVFAAMGLTLGLVVWTLESVRSPARYPRIDASDAARFVRDDGGLARAPGACWAFVDHFFVWARGELMQGQRVQKLELRTADLAHDPTRAALSRCAYALTGHAAAERAVRQLGPNWRLTFRSRNGYAVLSNDAVRPTLAAPAENAPAPRPPGREVPLDAVPSAPILRAYEERLAKEPANHVVRRKLADFCLARRLPCALTQYEHLLREAPADAELLRLRDAAKAR